MAIIDDYDAIARRLRELAPSIARPQRDIDRLDEWKELAQETARVYVQNRRKELLLRGLIARGRPRLSVRC
jgi:hypothetical protein